MKMVAMLLFACAYAKSKAAGKLLLLIRDVLKGNNRVRWLVQSNGFQIMARSFRFVTCSVLRRRYRYEDVGLKELHMFSCTTTTAANDLCPSGV